MSWYAFLAVGEGSEQSKPVVVDLGKLAETGGTAAANDGTRSRKGKPERGRTTGQADQGGSPGSEPTPASRAVEDKKRQAEDKQQKRKSRKTRRRRALRRLIPQF